MPESQRREHQLRKLSRFLSLLLRHRPARFPIKLDAQGFADLDKVMRMVKALPNFRWATYDDVEAVLALPGRRRFEIVEDASGKRIRALYGHTALRPDYEPVTPPDVLYHATAPETVWTIRQEGIQPMARQYVHLTADRESARRIGLRHAAEPVVLRVDAQAARADGIRFFHPTDEIWLVEAVPPKYVS